ncbi:ABC transporter ATP-binding protein [Vibrio cholerae]|uniref:ABC transporter ATP-binding protein n=1 Tax=Vibrio cholerae TaxID=666 RepID=UPI000B48D4AF|nr:ABC transporter ATP-binding protein [Vibrio cholerae]EGQ9613091.1 ABC transporter ATP-binding protein [Vibrio cholerae]EGR4458253.1 ABC transporter ATP-binding protein [Vibrio cholerae]EGR5448075.1 ABC transporter ATP-binding protein [Vibrio cholerae]EGR5456072.1 ABC transporter ATP-binding protein [Vibrio cholerae]EGR5464263.1 ABC transporter ATP-binding protein [Vibrio cholerae]
MNTVIFDKVELTVPVSDRHQSFKSLILNITNLRSEKKKILSIPSFTAKAGDKVCVVGRNGNGKTNFMKVLSGIYPHTSGKVWTKFKPTAVLAAGIGLEEELSVYDNINLSLIFKGVPKERVHRIREEILDFCELKSDVLKQFKHLSTGYKSRLAFAIAISEEPKILVLDEVLGGGDEFFMKKANKKLMETIEQAQTAFIATHGPDEFKGICNRLIVIDKGTINFDGEFNEGLAHYRSMYN